MLCAGPGELTSQPHQARAPGTAWHRARGAVQASRGTAAQAWAWGAALSATKGAPSGSALPGNRPASLPHWDTVTFQRGRGDREALAGSAPETGGH